MQKCKPRLRPGLILITESGYKLRVVHISLQAKYPVLCMAASDPKNRWGYEYDLAGRFYGRRESKLNIATIDTRRNLNLMYPQGEK